MIGHQLQGSCALTNSAWSWQRSPDFLMTDKETVSLQVLCFFKTFRPLKPLLAHI
jgi:hypothetical protein